MREEDEFGIWMVSGPGKPRRRTWNEMEADEKVATVGGGVAGVAVVAIIVGGLVLVAGLVWWGAVTVWSVIV